MMENCGSKIHQKAMALSTVGTIQGSRMMARISDLKGMCWFISNASHSPSANFPKVAMPV